MIETVVAGCLPVVMLVSMEIGYRIGHRTKFSDPQTSIEVIGTVDAAVFGLLGLIPAFTFSGASAGAMLSGYAMSRQSKRSMLHMRLFSLVVSASVYVVLDLEHPRAGIISLRSMDQALYQLRETMR